MRRSTLLAFSLALSLVAAAPAGAATATHSENMTHIATLPYEARNGDVPNFGTDIEFTKIGNKQYAFAGSYRNGMQIVDISRPERAKRVGLYDCGVTQGDVQIFRQSDERGRVFATYTSDTFGDGTSTCYREAEALGYDMQLDDGSGEGKNGTFIVDVTNPAAPKTVSFVEVPQGSHNQTVHPSGNFLYNSNSDLINSIQPAIEIFDISDPRHPVAAGELSLPPRPGLGTESHDITFNESGSRAYSAALSQGVVINTEDPAKPSIVSSWLDPTINVWHQCDPFTQAAEDGSEREFVICEDEVAGAIGTGQCPNGGVHVYDVTGDLEKAPEKVGYWNIDEVRPTTGPDNSCTAHVFDIHEREQLMTIAYYNGGVRVVDISGLAGISLGDDTSISGEGMKEIGFYRFSDADSWSFKSPKVSRTGDFYAYGNDIARGLDIYKFRGEGGKSQNKGRWMSAQEANVALAGREKVALTEETKFFCLIGN